MLSRLRYPLYTFLMDARQKIVPVLTFANCRYNISLVVLAYQLS